MLSFVRTKLPITFLSLLLIVAGCTKTEEDEPLSISKEINGIALKRADGVYFLPSEVQVTIKADSIIVIVPAGTDLNGLIPVISITGISISPASGLPQNFNFPWMKQRFHPRTEDCRHSLPNVHDADHSKVSASFNRQKLHMKKGVLATGLILLIMPEISGHIFQQAVSQCDVASIDKLISFKR